MIDLLQERKNIMGVFRVVFNLTVCGLVVLVGLVWAIKAWVALEARLNLLEFEIRAARQQVEELKVNQAELQEFLLEIKNILSGATELEVEATAYTHVRVPGVSDINGNGDGITATGLPVREGLIAVDPAVIPLGSRVYIEGFGTMLAADTGGAIKGKRIDIFMENRAEALRFGRRGKIRVLILSAS